MTVDADAVVIGAGPAGGAASILLAMAGWRVVLVEQHAYPRQKVCGECVGAGNLALIDRLGVGSEFRRLAGVELRQAGWMGGSAWVRAALPICREGPYPYGRAVGRDGFDMLLLERARSLGVRILQPARVRAVRGTAGRFSCEIGPAAPCSVTASVIIDAHGSWERAPGFASDDAAPRGRQRPSDLFAFKATFRHTHLEPGFLPVLALDGGYGGMVLADRGRMTLACCVRRDALHRLRRRRPGVPAGAVVEAFLSDSCRGVSEVLGNASRDGRWLSVGPLRPGIRLRSPAGVFRVGNAAGEMHPLIGEGISMALQSSALLVDILVQSPASAIDVRAALRQQAAYAGAWRAAFVPRARLATLYAHVAMRPALAGPALRLLRRWPALLTRAAAWAGKTKSSVPPPSLIEETP